MSEQKERVRNPQQQRAMNRRVEILKAAEAVIAEVGRDRFTTQMIIDRTEGSVGILYRYFRDRHDILDALYPNRVEGLGEVRYDWEVGGGES